MAAVVAVCLSAASCSIETWSLALETRQPSRSGLDLGGKTVAVAYLEGENGADSTFGRRVSDGFAQVLEADGVPGISQYRMVRREGGDYASRDTLVALLMDCGEDVVFLFDAPMDGVVTVGERRDGDEAGSFTYPVTVPYAVQLYAYDSMASDTVRAFRGSDVLKAEVSVGSGGADEGEIRGQALAALSAIAEEAGRNAAETFVSQWKRETFTFTYVDNFEEEWTDALGMVQDMDFAGAIKEWEKLLGTGSMSKRSAAEYNIAVACYLLGTYDLSSKWLDLSDKDFKLPYSAALRARIAAAKQ